LWEPRVNLAVFAAILFPGGLHHIVAAVGAFCVAWLNNFVLNRHWTFRDNGGSVTVQGARYLATSLVALGLNLVILEVLVSAGMNELLSQAIAILVVTPAAFLMNRRWAFR
jgi:putative flippase GtrA